jgi:hypothetical protein
MRNELSDYEWTAIKPMLPEIPQNSGALPFSAGSSHMSAFLLVVE